MSKPPPPPLCVLLNVQMPPLPICRPVCAKGRESRLISRSGAIDMMVMMATTTVMMNMMTTMTTHESPSSYPHAAGGYDDGDGNGNIIIP
jgi:hypothetical protein